MLLDADQRRGPAGSLRQLVRDPSKENLDEEPSPPPLTENQSSIVELDSESPSENPLDNSLYDSDEQLEQNANEDAESENRQGTIEEESIEQYMQRLLNRVRGGGENELAATPSTALASPALASSSDALPDLLRTSVTAASIGLDSSDVEPLPAAQKKSEELFVPRQQFLEQRNDLAALRELANTNARRAISRSDNRRTNSAFYVKLGITALAVSSAAALFMFNGFELNAPFAGMVSSIIVSILWGYDCINHFKRLKNAGSKNRVTMAEAAAGQSIQVGSAESSGWRPISG